MVDAAITGDDFIQAYKDLPTADARHKLLQSLVQQLSIPDCHILHNSIYARLHVDILGCLPIELVAGIASYLPPWDVFRYRSVSKRWNEVLSSPFVCSSSFDAYFPDQEQLDVSGPYWPRRFHQVSKRRLALVTGRPYSKSLLLNGHPWRVELISYHDGMIAHDLDHRRTIQVLSVVDGPIATYQTRNREVISKIALSRTALAVVTIRGYCHVFHYETGEEGSFRLPCQPHSLVVDEDAVALHVGTRPTTIITWDLQSRHAREIKNDSSSLLHMFLDGKDASLVLVHGADADGTPMNDKGKTPPPNFSGAVGTRYLLRGATAVLQDKITYFMLPPDEPQIPHDCMKAFNTYGRCVVTYGRRVGHQDVGNPDPWEYGEHRWYLLVIVHPKYQPQHHHHSKIPPVVIYRDPIPQLMKARPDTLVASQCPDVIHYYYSSSEKFNYAVANYLTATYASSEIDDISNDNEFVMGDTKPTNPEHIMGGDDRFFVITNELGIHVWCFDEDVALFQETSRYREIRRGGAEARARAREWEREWNSKQEREWKIKDDKMTSSLLTENFGQGWDVRGWS
ncbi:hypothetical protein AJ78_08211 [Emergomyces pasteurianus Ep9510]|uniref:F-box domain-containing protein n=1 Tax=Emergomyces pasteurianus Ep9510 TaxID=1447872 RepID=A0A1J9P2B5_9EURO|nr:hypothetical protein AJ78_08211 [Emergomyces pasteurianus Ep9510]